MSTNLSTPPLALAPVLVPVYNEEHHWLRLYITLTGPDSKVKSLEEVIATEPYMREIKTNTPIKREDYVLVEYLALPLGISKDDQDRMFGRKTKKGEGEK